ncbi:MYND-type domain-containing protein [Mycena sanguinolenta]|uniref:MYND-type domain-containing protein n=1 Tax=Mycena sanguinolenta TaxID=230812 RepID=A0A8H6YS48_9AGAR|nr:MYND-type domain-containing protein [Mycena sanguinolenta]
MCLQGLLLIDTQASIPEPPSVDLWERVWPWLAFLDTYQDHLPRRLGPGLGISDFSSLLLINGLAKDNTTARLMVATPGFRILIFRAWAQSLDQCHQTKLVQTQTEGLFGMLCVVMHRLPLTITSERDFEEAIEGSGGSRLALARLCVKHIKSVVQPAVISDGADSMRTVIFLLQMRCKVDESFRQLLVDQGIVSALTSVACHFTSPPFAQDHLNLSRAVNYYLRMPYGHKLLIDALRAGLLRALLAYGRISPPPESGYREQLIQILVFFSESSVYLSFLQQLRVSLEELEIDAQTFQGFELSDLWEALWSILQSRWDFMELYLKREKRTIMATCSNLACRAIAHKSEFKRCSGCKSCKYCSKACQTRDWQHGGHRQLCGWDGGGIHVPRGQPLPLEEVYQGSDTVSRRDLSFMRALLHYDYLRLKRSILADELAFLRSNPGTPFYVEFDYCMPSITSTVQVSVKAVSSLRHGE